MVVLLALSFCIHFQLYGQGPKKLIMECYSAMGGKAVDSIKFIKTHYFGHQYWIEQSENPRGPYLTSYIDADEIRSIEDELLYQKTETKHFQAPKPQHVEAIINKNYAAMRFGSNTVPMQALFYDRYRAWLNYCPLKIVKLALHAQLKFGGKINLEGIPHYQIAFVSKELSGQLFINANTFLLTQLEVDTYLPNEYYFSVWGKFKTIIKYTVYSLNSGNIFYPMQWDIFCNGDLYSSYTINELQFLKDTDPTLFEITDDVKQKMQSESLVKDQKLAIESSILVKRGIHMVPGNWNVGWVEQEDGIFILEAPISSWFSRQVMDAVKKQYPKKPIKGVLISSDAWPHLGGAREYFAEGIPIYTHALNKDILMKLSNSDYSIDSDKQQAVKATPIFKFVKNVTTLKDSYNPIMILPIDGEGGERMLAAYIPETKTLYASDLLQYSNPRKKEFFFLEYLNEIRNVVDRNNLQVELVFAMHLMPIPWSEIETALNNN